MTKEQKDFCFELENCAQEIAAVQQTFSAISVAAASDTFTIGPQTLLIPCTTLMQIANRMDELYDKATALFAQKGE